MEIETAPTGNVRRPNVDEEEGQKESEEWQHGGGQTLNCRFIFSFLLIEAAFHLATYINKLFADSTTAREYYDQRHLYGLAISVVCMVAPTVVYTLYETLRTVLLERGPREILTKMIKGLLLIPWQIKAHCDLLHFAAEQACSCRPLSPKEQNHLSHIKQEAFVLEFFVDFYAGFFQLLLQVHFLLDRADRSASELAFYHEIVASALAVFSLIKAIQRMDDGCLSRILSFIGWISFCASKVLALALLSSIISLWVLLAILLHAVVASVFIFRIIKEAQREISKSETRENTQRRPLKRTKDGVLAILTFFQFGLPSLMHWPMIFAFKKASYVMSFLGLSIAENFLCFLVWFIMKKPNDNSQLDKTYAIVMVVLTLVAVTALILYMKWKGDQADMVCLAIIRQKKTNNFGIYFDFCNAVQILPDTSVTERRIEQISRLRPDLV